MGFSPRVKQLTPYIGAAIAIVSLGGGVAWLQSRPPQPAFDLAAECLALWRGWESGEVAIPDEALRLDELRGWARDRVRTAGGAPFELNGALPALPLPLTGVRPIEVKKHPGLVAAFGDGRARALLLVLDVSASPLLGPHEARLLDEWSLYRLDAGDVRVLVWFRPDNLFALATDLDAEAARRSIPDPTIGARRAGAVAPGLRPEEAFKPPSVQGSRFGDAGGLPTPTGPPDSGSADPTGNAAP